MRETTPPGVTLEPGSRPPDPPARRLLQALLESHVIPPEDWRDLPPLRRSELLRSTHTPALLAALVEECLLTPYQAARAAAGTAAGLVLGEYRILAPVREGSRCLVFRAEHLRLRQPVAIKVLGPAGGRLPVSRQRFDAEVRAIAQLNHPAVVRALDAGEAPGPDPHAPGLHYYVMEYVEGQNLDELVTARGPLPAAYACGLARQVAGALAEADAHGLVHRDVKPANVMASADGRAKLLDFGLVRQLRRRLTEHGTLLGSLDFIAPEQVRDAAAVDIRADIYGLGATLFWCLTGRRPFALPGGLAEAVRQRATAAAPSVRAYRPDVPTALAAVVSRMMALRPEERYPTPQAVQRALDRFIDPQTYLQERPALAEAALFAKRPADPVRVLVVEDNHDSAESLRLLLGMFGYDVTVARTGPEGMEAARRRRPQVVLCDIGLPGLDGYGVATALRHRPETAAARLIAITGYGTEADKRRAFAAGFDEHLVKPVDPEHLLGRLPPVGTAPGAEPEAACR